MKMSTTGEIWPCLLEKAFAQLAGSWAMLQGGAGWKFAGQNCALAMLTGSTDISLMQRTASSHWTLCGMKLPNSFDWRNWPDTGTDGHTERPTKVIFEHLCAMDRENCIMVCSAEESP